MGTQSHDHHQHRQRLKARVQREGLDSLEDHEVLEYLLYFTIPLKDTNPLAHALLKQFGSLPDVFEASYETLCAVDGVGPHTASFLTAMPGVLRRYMDRVDRKNVVLTGTEQIVDFLLPQFLGRTLEWFYLICENKKHQVVYAGFLAQGTIDSVLMDPRRIMELCLAHKATGIILAHNHPGALAVPSPADMRMTCHLAQSLRSFQIVLRDHIIFDNSDAVSMRDSGYFSTLKIE